MAHHLAVLLDGDHVTAVERIWTRLEERFGLSGVRRVPLPHISLYALDSATDEQLHARLEQVAGSTAPFRVHAHGYVLFVGDHPSDLSVGVLVVRSTPLSRLQDLVRQACGAEDGALAGQFAHDVWTPHVTLADRDLAPSTMGQVVEQLAARSHPSWSIPIDNLACLVDGADGPEVSWRRPLTGSA